MIEKGVYGFAIGANVRDARRAWAFTQAETVVLEQLEEAAAPAEPFFILTAKEVDGVHVSVQEPVHTRTVDLKQKILQSLPAGVPITGDRGYRLDDVKAGKVTLDAFVAQLDPTELEAISRGAYIMNSPLGAPGNAGVFGGVLPSLRKRVLRPSPRPTALRASGCKAAAPCCRSARCLPARLTRRLSGRYMRRRAVRCARRAATCCSRRG